MPTVRKSVIRAPESMALELALDYTFSSRVLEITLGPVFGHITETLVEDFVARAEALG